MPEVLKTYSYAETALGPRVQVCIKQTVFARTKPVLRCQSGESVKNGDSAAKCDWRNLQDDVSAEENVANQNTGEHWRRLLHTGLVCLGQVPRVPRDLDRDARQRPAVQQTSPALRTAVQQTR